MHASMSYADQLVTICLYCLQSLLLSGPISVASLLDLSFLYLWSSSEAETYHSSFLKLQEGKRQVKRSCTCSGDRIMASDRIMVDTLTEDNGGDARSSSSEEMPSDQQSNPGDSLAEWRSSEQVENGTPSTSPAYSDTDDDDCGMLSNSYCRYIFLANDFR